MQAKSNSETASAAGLSSALVRKITISGIVMASYIIIMFLTQGFAFGQYQIRIATSIYALSAIYPFLIIPMGLSNFLSNTLLGGLGILDMLGGLVVGILTSSAVYLIKKYNLNDWLMALPIVFIPGLVVPIWLAVLLNLPYKILAASIIIGQIIPALVGVVLVQRLRKLVKSI